MTNKKILISATLVGLCISFIFLSVGLMHSPQCEFYCEGWIDWEYIIFFLAFSTVFIGGLLYFFLFLGDLMYKEIFKEFIDE